MGADRKLLEWEKVVAYFNQLARTSNKIRVAEIGKSTEGRPYIAATIAAPETLAKLDQYLAIQRKLADPRTTTDAEAERLITQGKTIMMITCSIHSTEVASTSTAIEFAYKLITEDKPKFRNILNNTILILVPSQNPDGVDIVTKWYNKTLGTPYEGTTPPELYHKYVGHDDNRDWYIFSQAETQISVSKLHNVWHPQVVYDVHQQGAYASRLFVPPWLDPIDPNVDPILSQLGNAIGTTIASDLTTAGRKGIAINAIYDFWTPARHYQSYHGGVRILTESASTRLATPITVKPEEISGTALGYNPKERSWNYLEPWLGGEWRQRDIVDDQLLAFESIMNFAAVRREDMLRGFYRIGKKALANTSSFVIPSTQSDPGATKKMLDTLKFGDVEIDRAKSAFTAAGKQYPAGSYVIKLAQPYGSFAKTLLERQNYPDLRVYPGGPPRRPYDVTAQTLPLLMGVQVDTINEPFTADLERAKEITAPADPLDAANVYSWKTVNAAWAAGKPVYRDPATGNFSLTNGRQLKRPRVALYKSYVPSMDEGWTRWLLEQFGFGYTSVYNKDLQAGNLKDRFDVIVFPEQRPNTMHAGHAANSMPEPYTGGIGDTGAEQLKRFASQGGTLVFLNDASEYAVEHLGAGVKNALHGVSNRDFYCPGALLNARLDTTHPLNYGMPKEAPLWFESGPVFDLADRAKGVATYPGSKILASGWLLGEGKIAGKSAVVDVPVGSGHMILFGIRPQYRAQSYLTFKMFFNSLVYFEQ